MSLTALLKKTPFSFLSLSALAAILFLCALPASAQVKASLVSAATTIQPGQTFTVALRLQHDSHWHTYWKNPGIGLPTSIEWKLPEGFSAGPILWPAPGLIKDSSGAVSGYGYEGDLLLPVALKASQHAQPGKITLSATAEWLMCAESCVPGKAELSLDLTISKDSAQADPAWAARIQETLAAMPVSPRDLETGASRSGKVITLTVRTSTPLDANGARFYSEDGLIAHDQPQSVRAGAQGALVFTLPVAEDPPRGLQRLIGVITRQGAPAWRIDTPFEAGVAREANLASAVPQANAKTGTRAEAGAKATVSLPSTLLLALVGGLILNLMPCVFPVLGIKILGFVQQAGADKRKVILHGLVFTVGVLLSFWVLAGVLAALRSGGSQLGWGFQLQSPAFVFVLAVVMLVFALNMSGLFEFGLSATSVGANLQMQSGYGGSFFTGVLATVVATPCSAPFLAPALGAALTLSTVESFAVFTAIALGLSAPYLLLSLFPAAVKLLPRPGAWMETFKQFMAFPLYATVGYLVWVLAGQVTESHLLTLLVALVLVALGVWIYGRWNAPGAKPTRARAGTAAGAVVCAAGIWLGWPAEPKAGEPVWEPWSAERVAALRAQDRIIYVDFTARWCATCQANKRVVFGSAEVLRLLADKKVALLKADWTNRDPAITRELARLGRSAVPVNLVYKPGAAEPAMLPELLTPGIVLDALR